MPKPQMRTEELSEARSAGEYAPKKYSAREHAVMGVKAILLGGGLIGLLWLLNTMAVK